MRCLVPEASSKGLIYQGLTRAKSKIVGWYGPLDGGRPVDEIEVKAGSRSSKMGLSRGGRVALAIMVNGQMVGLTSAKIDQLLQCANACFT